MFEDPKSYGLPHDEWRPHQYEVLQEIKAMGESDTLIIRAKTGSGKSAWAAAIGHSSNAMVLSQTKLLQKQGYHDRYGFSYLFGAGSYPCPLRRGTVSASYCSYSDKPKSCPAFHKCQYYKHKERVMKARRKALNYAYFQGAKWPRILAPYGHLFLDEAHLLADLVIDYASVEIDSKVRRKWNLPDFPRLTSAGQGSMFNGTESEATAWLEKAHPIMEHHVDSLAKDAVDNPASRTLLSNASELKWKIYGALKFLRQSKDDWFILSGPSVFRSSQYGEGMTPGIVIKPLVARHHFSSQFILGGPTVLMTATTGDPTIFAEGELGIKDYEFIDVPSTYPPESRPIYYFRNGPRVSGRKAKGSDFEHQADLMAEVIKSCPSNWTGVIHTTSIRAAYQLAGRLAHRGLADRVWVTPKGKSTNELLGLWERAKRRGRGMIAIAWSWWVGVDLLSERICLVAKCPFPFCGSEYTRARMRHDREGYMQRTTRKFFQGCGRTRRGRPQDYDLPDKRRGVVAVFDSAWTSMKPYMSDDQFEQMTPWPT